jgi:hypothetical protein
MTLLISKKQDYGKEQTNTHGQCWHCGRIPR